MVNKHALRISQVVVAIIWIAVFWFGIKWFLASGIPIRHLPRVLKGVVRAFGLWGPLLIIALHVFHSIFFLFPTTVISLISGSLYGPIFGTLLNIVGENLAANASFGIGRLFGRRFVRSHENGWVKKYDDLLRQEGFLTILFMRSLYFPFDIVNYGSGMTGIMYRQYAIGTFLGLLAPIITVSVLGDAFTDPRAFIAFSVLTVFTIAAAFLLRRSAWAKKRIYPKHVHETI